MIEIINDIQNLIDTFLLPNADKVENKVFYLKLKADYFRYYCEIAKGKELDNVCDSAEKFYKEAYEISNKEIPINNPVRLGLALNYSIFCYEIKSLKEEACEIAKNAFDEAMKVLDELEKCKSKDCLIIIQLIKENFILWQSEMSDD